MRHAQPGASQHAQSDGYLGEGGPRRGSLGQERTGIDASGEGEEQGQAVQDLVDWSATAN